MLVNGTPCTTITYQADSHTVSIIDQTRLPHHFETVTLRTLDEFCHAIEAMLVRGAPLIGATAAYALAFALVEDGSDDSAATARARLIATRPTAVNLRWAVDRVWQQVAQRPVCERGQLALEEAQRIREEDIETCERIGDNGLHLLREAAAIKSGAEPLNIMTHCNAGWLATVDWGTALAPIYKAQLAGIPLHVWVNETRPRNQGASLTAWELRQQGVAHTVVADNCAGHLMQQGMVDLCIVGSDRTSANGDVCNKIGTYLRALAASDNNIPFYVALPESTIDWSIDNGLRDIPIEQRGERELTHISGLTPDGSVQEVQLIEGSTVANFAFDVTPARLVSALITEFGVYKPRDLNTLKQAVEGKPQ